MPAERPRLRRVTCRQVLLYEDLLWFQNFSRCGRPELLALLFEGAKKGGSRACPPDTNRLDPRSGAWPCWRPYEFRMPNKTLLATRATMRIPDTAIAW
jgi:hypothetical protein